MEWWEWKGSGKKRGKLKVVLSLISKRGCDPSSQLQDVMIRFHSYCSVVEKGPLGYVIGFESDLTCEGSEGKLTRKTRTSDASNGFLSRGLDSSRGKAFSYDCPSYCM